MNAERILILGYGREGQSLLRFLRRSQPSAVLAVADKSPAIAGAEELNDIRVIVGDGHLACISEYDVIFRSPGVPLCLPELERARASGRRVTSLMNLFFDHAPGTIIGVTGTKGKSTTSALIAHLLRSSGREDVRLVGNIGRPAIDELEGANGNTVFVVELSSFQLEDLSKSPRIAVILGIVPEHLDHHGTFDAYRDAKANITLHQSASDILVFNPLAPQCAAIAERSKARHVCFSVDRSAELCAFVHGGLITVTNPTERRILPVRDLPLIGEGNLQNVLAAVAAASAAGADTATFPDALRTFRPLAHRLEPLGEFRGIRFYNDSLSTIPEAAVNALGALGDSVTTLLAGGYDRGLTFGPLAKALAGSNVRTLILFPTTGAKILQALAEEDPEYTRRMRCFHVESMREAVELAYEHTEPGSMCLLSPASSSFGMFRDYQDRGESFGAFVRELAQRRH